MANPVSKPTTHLANLSLLTKICRRRRCRTTVQKELRHSKLALAAEMATPMQCHHLSSPLILFATMTGSQLI
jgi:hypothetical protein